MPYHPYSQCHCWSHTCSGCWLTQQTEAGSSVSTPWPGAGTRAFSAPLHPLHQHDRVALGRGPATQSHPVHPQGGVRGESQENGAQKGITCPTGTPSDEVEGPSRRGPTACVVNTLLSLWDEMGLHVTLRLGCGAVRGDSCSREQGLASLTVRP